MFDITFVPKLVGTGFYATVQIKTNSQNDSDFSFRVKGNGSAPGVGQIGPSGGKIFYAQGGQYKECSAKLGEYTWNQAITMASDYRGGNFTDWRLPNRWEMGLIHDKGSLISWGIPRDNWYWTSEEASSSTVWYLYHWNGELDTTAKTNINSVVVVRDFTL